MRRAGITLWGSFLLLAAGSSVARADPPYAFVEVKVGDVAFSRLYNVRLIASADPAIATVETVAATGELIITGHAPGRTDLVALSGGRLIGVGVVVRAEGKAPPPPPGDGAALLAAAKKACPNLKDSGEGKDAHLELTGPSVACRAALEPLLASGRWTVQQTRINFDTDSLLAQLTEMNAALKAAGVSGLQLHYQGASLMLAGHLSAAEAPRALVALYHASVGGVPLDDDDLSIEGEEDGGF